MAHSSSSAFSTLFPQLGASSTHMIAPISSLFSQYPDSFMHASHPASQTSSTMLPGGFLSLPTVAIGTGHDYNSSTSSCLTPCPYPPTLESPRESVSVQYSMIAQPFRNASLSFAGTTTIRDQSSAHEVQCSSSTITSPPEGLIALAPVATVDAQVTGNGYRLGHDSPLAISIPPQPADLAASVHPTTPQYFSSSLWSSSPGELGVHGADNATTANTVHSLLFNSTHDSGCASANHGPSAASQPQWTSFNRGMASSSSSASSSTASPSVTVSTTPCLSSLFGPPLGSTLSDASPLAFSPTLGSSMMNLNAFPSSAWLLPAPPNAEGQSSPKYPLESLVRPTDAAAVPAAPWITAVTTSRAAESPLVSAATTVQEPCLYASPSVLTCTSTGDGQIASAGSSMNVFGGTNGGRAVMNPINSLPRLSLTTVAPANDADSFSISPTSTCSSLVPSAVYAYPPPNHQQHHGFDFHTANTRVPATAVASPASPYLAKQDIATAANDMDWTGAGSTYSSSSSWFPQSPMSVATMYRTGGSLADAIQLTPSKPSRVVYCDTSSLSSSCSLSSNAVLGSSLSPAPSSSYHPHSSASSPRSSVSPAPEFSDDHKMPLIGASTSSDGAESDTDSTDDYHPQHSPTPATTRPTRQRRGGAKTKPSLDSAVLAKPPATKPPTRLNRRARHRCPHPGCGRVFCQLTHLRTHVRTHTGERPHVCPHPGCGQSFAQSGNLVTHMRGHTGEKPYICSVCSRAFAQLGNLRTHERMHSGVRPYRCIVNGCQSQFSQLGNLRTHQLRLHGIPRGSDLAGIAIVSLDRSIHAASTAAFRVNSRGEVVGADAESDEEERMLVVTEKAENVDLAEDVIDTCTPPADSKDKGVDSADNEVAEVVARVKVAKKTVTKTKAPSRKRKARATVDNAERDEGMEKCVNEVDEPMPPTKRRRTTRRAGETISLEPVTVQAQPVTSPSPPSSVEPVSNATVPFRPFVPILPHPHVTDASASQQPMQLPMVLPGGLPPQPPPPPSSVYVPNPLRPASHLAMNAGLLDTFLPMVHSTTAGGKYVPIAPAPTSPVVCSDSLVQPRLSIALGGEASGRKSPISFMR